MTRDDCIRIVPSEPAQRWFSVMGIFATVLG
jgi:hypothetical protein